jgi:hypothetical protein
MQNRMRSWLILAGLLAGTGCAWATDREQREFSVIVNGKEAGHATIDINQQDDGLTYVTARTNIKFQRLIFNYALAVEAAEWWRNGQLVGLKCQATENGKKTDVAISGKGNDLKARVNGEERPIGSEVWTSSFWKLPDAKYHNKQITMFEIDTGKEYQGQLQWIAAEQLTVLGKLEKCFHFRYTGGSSPTDLWFDQYHRLVRQEFTELGQKTIVQIINIRR